MWQSAKTFRFLVCNTIKNPICNKILEIGPFTHNFIIYMCMSVSISRAIVSVTFLLKWLRVLHSVFKMAGNVHCTCNLQQTWRARACVCSYPLHARHFIAINICTRKVGGLWSHEFAIYGYKLTNHFHKWRFCDFTDRLVFVCGYYHLHLTFRLIV